MAADRLLRFERSSKFDMDLRRARATQGLEKQLAALWELLEILRKKLPIPAEFKAHKMGGDWVGWWDCHLAGDLVLIWKYETRKSGKVSQEVVLLARVGTHAYLGI